MFVGRKEEKEQLLKAIERPGSLSIVYGNRRVGKTTLANQTCIASKLDFVSFECLKSTLEDNVSSLVDELVHMGIIQAKVKFDSMIELFRFVNSLNRRVVFVIDEYPYLYIRNNKDFVDSSFQTIVDKHLSNLNIILSGSHIGMMKTLTKQGNPLFGRAELIINLKELNYLEASEFCSELSPYEKASFYCVFGGLPFVLSQLDYSKDVAENIKRTFLNPASSIYAFVSEGYTTDVSTRTYANNVFSILSNGNKRHNQIEDELGYDHNGLLSKKLNELMEMEFIAKNYPINKNADDKKATYYILNNALRFFFAYVYGKANTLSLLGAEAFYKGYVEGSLVTFISHRFESMVRQYFSLQVKKGLRPGITDIGTYYYDDPVNKRNGEFDVALKRSQGGYALYEAKFLKGPVDGETISKELKQISQVRDLNVSQVGFVSINGFSFDGVFELIDGNDLYRK